MLCGALILGHVGAAESGLRVNKIESSQCPKVTCTFDGTQATTFEGSEIDKVPCCLKTMYRKEDKDDPDIDACKAYEVDTYTKSGKIEWVKVWSRNWGDCPNPDPSDIEEEKLYAKEKCEGVKKGHEKVVTSSYNIKYDDELTVKMICDGDSHFKSVSVTKHDDNCKKFQGKTDGFCFGAEPVDKKGPTCTMESLKGLKEFNGKHFDRSLAIDEGTQILFERPMKHDTDKTFLYLAVNMWATPDPDSKPYIEGFTMQSDIEGVEDVDFDADDKCNTGKEKGTYKIPHQQGESGVEYEVSWKCSKKRGDDNARMFEYVKLQTPSREKNEKNDGDCWDIDRQE